MTISYKWQQFKIAATRA